jgi:hypothetical protein
MVKDVQVIDKNKYWEIFWINRPKEVSSVMSLTGSSLAGMKKRSEQQKKGSLGSATQRSEILFLTRDEEQE